jgi:hypothetical protein
VEFLVDLAVVAFPHLRVMLVGEEERIATTDPPTDRSVVIQVTQKSYSICSVPILPAFAVCLIVGVVCFAKHVAQLRVALPPTTLSAASFHLMLFPAIWLRAHVGLLP